MVWLTNLATVKLKKIFYSVPMLPEEEFLHNGMNLFQEHLSLVKNNLNSLKIDVDNLPNLKVSGGLFLESMVNCHLCNLWKPLF